MAHAQTIQVVAKLRKLFPACHGLAMKATMATEGRVATLQTSTTNVYSVLLERDVPYAQGGRRERQPGASTR